MESIYDNNDLFQPETVSDERYSLSGIKPEEKRCPSIGHPSVRGSSHLGSQHKARKTCQNPTTLMVLLIIFLCIGLTLAALGIFLQYYLGEVTVRTISVKEGESVTLNIMEKMDKKTLRYIEWIFNNITLVDYILGFDNGAGSRAVFDTETFSLRLDNLTKNDSGHYVAQKGTTNGITSTVAEFNLDVLSDVITTVSTVSTGIVPTTTMSTGIVPTTTMSTGMSTDLEPTTTMSTGMSTDLEPTTTMSTGMSTDLEPTTTMSTGIVPTTTMSTGIVPTKNKTAIGSAAHLLVVILIIISTAL